MAAQEVCFDKNSSRWGVAPCIISKQTGEPKKALHMIDYERDATSPVALVDIFRYPAIVEKPWSKLVVVNSLLANKPGTYRPNRMAVSPSTAHAAIPTDVRH